MRDGVSGNNYPDEDIAFYDGFLYIISRGTDGVHTIDYHCLDPQYSEPLTLRDISEKYPYVSMVIYDSWRYGDIYRYSNHKEGEWERVGTTIGFA